MRDQHRPKQDLVSEVVALRKQVADLKDAMAARRRVEDALRHSEEQLRALVDGSPVGLALFRLDGTPVAVNRTFAGMLGYQSAEELLSVGGVLGIFATGDEQGRVVRLLTGAPNYSGGVLFRRKNGGPHAASVMGKICLEPEVIALVVMEELSAASSDGRRSA